MKPYSARLVLGLLLLEAFGCASGSRPEGVAAPSLAIARTGGPSGVGVTRQMSGAFSVSFGMQIRNEADVPIRLTRIELDTIGEGAYDLRRENQAFDRTIAPGEEEIIELWAVATPGSSVIGVGGQVTIRAVFFFEAKEQTFREVLTRSLRGAPAAR